MASECCTSVHTLEAESEVAGSAPSAVAARTTMRLLRCRAVNKFEGLARVLQLALRGAAEDSISTKRFAGRGYVPR